MKIFSLLLLLAAVLPGRAADNPTPPKIGPIITNLAPAGLPDFSSIGLKNLLDDEPSLVSTNKIKDTNIYNLPRPLTIEVRVKLNNKARGSIIVASEAKDSPLHWELYTAPDTGILKFAQNGPVVKAASEAGLADGAWHTVGAVIEEQRVRLYVDGKLVKDEAVKKDPAPAGDTIPARIALGTQSEGGPVFDGIVDSARLSRGVREKLNLPDELFTRDDQTFLLWNTDELKAYEKARIAFVESSKPPANKLRVTPPVKSLPSIVRGPYLQSGSTNSMVIRWRTDVPTPSLVRFGRTHTDLNKKASSYGLLTEHVVLITNLLPDTKYFYVVGTGDIPIYATLTNNFLFVSASNGVISVSAPNRLQFASANNGSFVIGASKKGLLVGDLATKALINTTNQSLLVSTPNQSLIVGYTNRVLSVSVSNKLHTSSARDFTTKKFTVGGAGSSFVGGDTNTWFYTAPRIGTNQPVRIWVLGDPGTRTKGQKAVRDAYYKFTEGRRTDLWLLLGDNAYDAGTDLQYQGSIFDVYQQTLITSVLWPTLGNHDGGTANSPTQSGVYYDIFTLPTRGESGGVMSGTKAYYSFDHANVHIICLDSYDSDRSTNGLMARWLKADLAANKQDWCIAYWHHPPYTKGSHDADKDDGRGEMTEMRNIIVPILEAGGVDMVLCGHSHAYERSFLLDGLYKSSNKLDGKKNIVSGKDGRPDGSGIYRKPTRGPAANEGAIYIVAGSSGQISGGGLQHPAMCLSINVLGSLVLDFAGPRLDTTFIDDKGVVRDYFSILKGPDEAAPKP